MTDVTVISAKGAASLVEWTGEEGVQRAIVPTSEVADNEVGEKTLDAGIEYGLPWEELVRLRVTPERIAHELRRRNIWTAADLRTRPMAVIAALQSAYGVDLAALRAAAEKFEKEQSL